MTQLVQKRGYLRQRQDVVNFRRSDGGLRHGTRLCALRVFDDGKPAEGFDLCQATCAVAVCARQDDADGALLVSLRRRLEQDIDGGTREGDRRLGRESEDGFLDQQVIVARRQIDASALDRVLIVRLGERQVAAPAQELAEPVVAVLFPVLRDDDRQGKLGRKLRQQRLQRREPTV